MRGPTATRYGSASALGDRDRPPEMAASNAPPSERWENAPPTNAGPINQGEFEIVGLARDREATAATPSPGAA